MSKKNHEKIKKYLDTDGALFDTLIITIGVVPYIENSDTPSRRYKISEIIYSKNETNFDFTHIQEFINVINEEISDANNTGFKSTDKKSGWSVFFLIKECIQLLSTGDFNFNYYRGQRKGEWETIPSAFRNIINDTGSDYYLEFENIYKDIYKKFPEKIKYIPFPEYDLSKNYNEYNDLIRKRGEQLSLLQHYELYTPLLDITSNPYIALLFMTNGQLEEPQLEFFDISQSPLFMEPVKTELNNRILAQKGAFLNYEMLLSKNQNGTTLIEELKKEDKTESKIPRVILKIKYQQQKTLEYNLKIKPLIQREALSDKSMDELLQMMYSDIQESKSQKNTSNETNLSEENKKEISHKEKMIYQDILEHLRLKLFEFKYIEDDLFPDFEDFLKNKMKLYKVPKKF